LIQPQSQGVKGTDLRKRMTGQGELQALLEVLLGGAVVHQHQQLLRRSSGADALGEVMGKRGGFAGAGHRDYASVPAAVIGGEQLFISEKWGSGWHGRIVGVRPRLASLRLQQVPLSSRCGVAEDQRVGDAVSIDGVGNGLGAPSHHCVDDAGHRARQPSAVQHAERQ
jgi:hypothetical protein